MSKALPKGGSALCYVQGYERPAFSRAAPTFLVGADALAEQTRSQFQSSMTGNAGLNYAAWQLSRRGWHVMPTIRNARGSDLIVTDGDETIFFGVQSKGLGKRHAVPLGRSIEDLRSEWWVITIHANSDHPVCFVMKKEEVRSLAQRDANEGAFWLNPPAYDRDEFREAWDRIGNSKD